MLHLAKTKIRYENAIFQRPGTRLQCKWHPPLKQAKKYWEIELKQILDE
jgi:hypothetical protein